MPHIFCEPTASRRCSASEYSFCLILVLCIWVLLLFNLLITDQACPCLHLCITHCGLLPTGYRSVTNSLIYHYSSDHVFLAAGSLCRTQRWVKMILFLTRSIPLSSKPPRSCLYWLAILLFFKSRGPSNLSGTWAWAGSPLHLCRSESSNISLVVLDQASIQYMKLFAGSRLESC